MEHFSVIRWCWGGDTVSAAAQPVFSRRQMTEGERKMEVECKSKTTHWKPKLQAISEECPMSDVDFGGVCRQISETDNTKNRVKVRAKAAAAAPPRPPPSCHGKGSWKPSPKITLPAFSPTPFLF